MSYFVAKLKYVQAPHFYEEEDRPTGQTEWVAIYQYGYHPRAIDAMRVCLADMDPDLADIPDKNVRKHWPSFRRRFGFKICRTQD
jgi:hypothetical protein